VQGKADPDEFYVHKPTFLAELVPAIGCGRYRDGWPARWPAMTLKAISVATEQTASSCEFSLGLLH
jgi:hypothetical protein